MSVFYAIHKVTLPYFLEYIEDIINVESSLLQDSKAKVKTFDEVMICFKNSIQENQSQVEDLWICTDDQLKDLLNMIDIANGNKFNKHNFRPIFTIFHPCTPFLPCSNQLTF